MMNAIDELWVMEESVTNSRSVNLVSAPVSDINQLLRVLVAADQNLPKEVVTFSMLFRGQDADLPLSPKGLSGNVSAKERALKRMVAVCRNAVGGERTDNEIYFMMRHAGLPSHLIDWSWQWEVALWFAIHSGDGCLKSEQASLWVLRPLMRDFNGDTIDGRFIRPVFFRADQHTCERSLRQDGSAYMIRFECEDDDFRPLPMNYDPNYRERLLRIPLTEELCNTKIETELISRRPDITKLLSDPGPIPPSAVKECFDIFNSVEQDKGVT